jgi:hypothetical protein
MTYAYNKPHTHQSTACNVFHILMSKVLRCRVSKVDTTAAQQAVQDLRVNMSRFERTVNQRTGGVTTMYVLLDLKSHVPAGGVGWPGRRRPRRSSHTTDRAATDPSVRVCDRDAA